MGLSLGIDWNLCENDLFLKIYGCCLLFTSSNDPFNIVGIRVVAELDNSRVSFICLGVDLGESLLLFDLDVRDCLFLLLQLSNSAFQFDVLLL